MSRYVRYLILTSLPSGCAAPPAPAPPPVPVVHIPPVLVGPAAAAAPSDPDPRLKEVRWLRATTVHELFGLLGRTRVAAVAIDHEEGGIMPSVQEWWDGRLAPAEWSFISFDGSYAPRFATQALILSFGGSYAADRRSVEVPFCVALEGVPADGKDLADAVDATFLGVPGCTVGLAEWLARHPYGR